MLTSFKPHISSLFVKKTHQGYFLTLQKLLQSLWSLKPLFSQTEQNSLWSELICINMQSKQCRQPGCSKVFMMFWCAEVKLGYSVYICMNKSIWDITPWYLVWSPLRKWQSSRLSCLSTSSSCLIRGTFQSAFTPLGHILAVPFAMSRADGQTDPEPLLILSSPPPRDSQHLLWKTTVRRIHKRARKFERGNVKEEKCNF